MNYSSGRIEGYILTRTLAAVAAALAVISAVIMLIDLVELSRTLGARTDVSFLRLVGMMFLKSPTVILLLLPFASNHPAAAGRGAFPLHLDLLLLLLRRRLGLGAS